MKVGDTNHVADFHDSRHRQSHDLCDFPRREVSVKIGVIEFGLYQTRLILQAFMELL